MKMAVEVITPEYAKQLLEQNPRNRKLSPALVERYALDMREGRWNEGNGQTVVIDRNGNLLDGQHRMGGVVRADVPVSFIVVRNVDPAGFSTIDTGKPRTLDDLLSIEGYTNSRVIGGAARLAWNYAAGVGLTYSPNRTILHEFVENHAYFEEIAGHVTNKSSGKTYPKVPLTGVLFLANISRQYDAEVETFIEGLTTGQGLYRGDPRLTLREWIIYHKTKSLGRTDLKTEALFGAAARAWNAHATGKTLTLLKGLHNPTRVNLPIIGYDPNPFSEVPDLKERWREAQIKNLGKGPLISAQKFNQRKIDRAVFVGNSGATGQ